MSDLDFCTKLTTIPQNEGTCWFNSILMIVFYSQNSRKLLLKEYINWDPNNKFLLICKDILLKYYIFSKDSILFFNKFKPQVILFYMLKYFNDYILKNKLKFNIRTKGYKELGYIPVFVISKFYRYLGIKILDIIYLKESNKYLLNFDKFLKLKNIYNYKYDTNINFNLSITDETNKIKQILDDIPDILIFNHSDISIAYTKHAKIINDLLFKKNNELENIYNSVFYSISINGLNEFKDIINFNGHSYKLESCLLENYNNDHVISGLTCKNNRYIFNGWNKTFRSTQENKLFNTDTFISCPLIKFNWNLNNHEPFCLNINNCTTDFKDNDKSCFSFNKAFSITLIYIRNDNPDINSSIDINNPLDIIPNVSFNPDFNSIIKNIHDIKTLSKDELISQLKNFDIIFNPTEKKSKKELQEILYSKLSEYYKYDISKSFNSNYSSNKDKDIDIIDDFLKLNLHKNNKRIRSLSKELSNEKEIKKIKLE